MLENLDADAELIARGEGRLDGSISEDLMSDNRRHNLADASLKGALIACHDGRLPTAVRCCLETLPLRHYGLCARCLALLPWIVAKRAASQVAKRGEPR